MNRAARVLAFLKEREGRWIDATRFESIGGRQAWRTAISEARELARLEGKDIVNRTQRVPSDDGEGFWLRSQYRLVPIETWREPPADLNDWSLT
jgi:hypothetical protein